jgi:hypothetical protein
MRAMLMPPAPDHIRVEKSFETEVDASIING